MIAPPPRYLSFLPHRSCNFRCPYCYYYGARGSFLGAKGRPFVPFAAWREALGPIVKGLEQVEIFGGEPLFYRDLGEALEFFRPAETLVITNGRRLEAAAGEIVDCPPDALAVSLDGLPGTHDGLRGNGSFRRAVAGLRAVARRRKEKPFLEAYVTVTPFNHRELAALHRLLRDEAVPIDRLNVFLASLFTPAMATSYRGFVAHFGKASTEALRWTEAPPGRSFLNEVAAQYERIRAEPSPFAVSLAPDAQDRLARFYRDDEWEGGCQAPDHHLALFPDGEAHFTTFFHEIRLGNVLEQGFDEVWNGAVAREYRRLTRERRFSFCRQCSQKWISATQRPFDL